MDYSRQDIAHFYYLGLLLGVVDRGAPIRWADQIIAESDCPDAQIIELSLAVGHPIDEVIIILKHLGESHTTVPVRLVAAQLLRQIENRELSEAQAANLCYRLAIEDEHAARAMGDEIWCIDELFEGWMCSPDDAPERVRQFLEPHRDLVLPPF